MKNIFLIILSCISLMSCSTTSKMKFTKNETLIRVNYKIPKYGYFTFLVFVNENDIKEIVYNYSLNIKERKYECSKISEKIYNKDVYCKQKDCHGFKKAKEFVFAKQYYTCIADNFLDMTNDEKIDLFNEISIKNVKK